VVPTNAKEKEYDNCEYEDQLYHFNMITRMSYYPHKIKDGPYDHCFDCASEIFILTQYCTQILGIEDENELHKKIIKLCREIDRESSITGCRTLWDTYAKPKVENRFAKKRHADYDK